MPDPERPIHLQFRRFAGCPVCDLHLRSFVKGIERLRDAHVREVVVFHSSEADLRAYEPELPFDVVADPGKALYREFGVEAGLRAVLDPRVFGTIVTAVAASVERVLRRAQATPPLIPEGGSLGLPADFLIDRDGVVTACHYGEHVYDQWSVDDVLGLVSRAG